MSPFPVSVFRSQPLHQARQTQAVADPVTLEITHSTTTYTTTIPLGASKTPRPLTTTISATSAPTVPRSTSSNNSGVIIGAVLGSIFGTIVILVILYKLCINPRSALWIPPQSYMYDSDMSDDVSSSVRTRRHRGGGGRGGGGGNCGYGMDDRRGNRVRRPEKVRIRTRRSSRTSPWRSEGSDGYKSRRSTRDRRRMVVGRNEYDGMLGFFLTPQRKRGHGRTSEWSGNGRTGDD